MDFGLVLGIGNQDWGFGLGIRVGDYRMWNWDWGFAIRDWDCGLGFGIWIGVWDSGLRMGIEIEDKD